MSRNEKQFQSSAEEEHTHQDCGDDDDHGWRQYCSIAGIDDIKGCARAGFDQVPRFLRVRRSEATISTNAIHFQQQQQQGHHSDTAAACVEAVDWLPRAARFYSAASRTTPLREVIASSFEARSPACPAAIVSMDASSFVPLLALCPRRSASSSPPVSVLDLCCAPGMKLVTLCDLLATTTSEENSRNNTNSNKNNSVVTGVDASLDRALVCRSILSQHVSRRKQVQEQIQDNKGTTVTATTTTTTAHCRLYLGDGTAFCLERSDRGEDGEEENEGAETEFGAPLRAPLELRCEASDPAKLARQEKYQLQRIRKDLAAETTRRRRERCGDEQSGEHETETEAAAAATTTNGYRRQQRFYCLYETQDCPVGASSPECSGGSQQKQNELTLLFDRVLVDAECTHDGSVAHADKFQLANFGDKSPKNFTAAKNSTNTFIITEEKLLELTQLQLRLLVNGFRNAKRNGGVIVYSTCSMSPKQNEGVVKAFLSLVLSHTGEGRNRQETKIDSADVVKLVDPFEELQGIFLDAKKEEHGAENDENDDYHHPPFSDALRFDDAAHFAKFKQRCIVSTELPPCVMLHPRVSGTSVQFIAKFVRLA